MADAYTDSTTDPYAAVRKRLLGGQYGVDDGFLSTDPAAPNAPTLAPATPSPDFAPKTADPSLLGPNYGAKPAPASFGGPATSPDQVPVPGVNPQVVYTDETGQGYDPAQLYASRNTLLQNPLHARIRDILQQYGYGSPAAAAAPASTAPPAPAGGAASSGAGYTPGAPAVMPRSAFNEDIRKFLLERIRGASTPVDQNAPEITETLTAARDEGTREAEQERTALAERLYAEGVRGGGGGGLNTGALTQQIQQSGERNAGRMQGLRANLLMNAYNQKAQQLQHFLSLAVASGDADSARAVQVELANLEAALRREGLGANLAMFGANLDQQAVLAGLNA